MPRLLVISAVAILLVFTGFPDFFSPGRQAGLGRAASANNAPNRSEKISPDLRDRISAAQNGDEIVPVILQLKGHPRGQLNALLNRSGVQVRGRFDSFNAMAVELPAAAVSELAAFDEVAAVNNDSDMRVLGHVTNTTGAEQVRTQTSAGGATYKLDGTGIGIAVLDSGIYANHRAFDDYNRNSRIVFSKDFTGENRIDDPYGHGTHVAAAAAAGNGDAWNNKYTGIAPNAKIINLRVLNSQGIGRTSQLLSALDWIYKNRNNSEYNIKVVNMSLGTPAVSSYLNDPLCAAVRKLVNAGFVVVAAAGNNGRDADGNKQYGLIHSPGNEPSAITVGATNGYGTDTRADDTVATYSSRGPTRSFYTDASGQKHYDNLIKPDLVAVGNKVIFAEAIRNNLVTQHPELDANLYNPSHMEQMYLSGSSVAAPITAGAAALLLQANPKLTPNMVKTILMYTAQQLRNFNTLEQGAGQLNVEGAVRLARLVRQDLPNRPALGSTLLVSAAPEPQSTVGGTTFQWAQGIIVNHAIVSGTNLITRYQKPYALGIYMSDGFTETNDAVNLDTTMMTNGLLLSDGIYMSDGTVLGSGTMFLSDNYLLGSGIYMSDGIYMTDGGLLMSDGIYMTDGIYMSDATVQSQTALVTGDSTSHMY